MSAYLRKSERVERLVSEGWWNEKRELLNELLTMILYYPGCFGKVRSSSMYGLWML